MLGNLAEVGSVKHPRAKQRGQQFAVTIAGEVQRDPSVLSREQVALAARRSSCRNRKAVQPGTFTL